MDDKSQLTELISALRAETETDSVSPERVGYVLQRMVDLFPSASMQLNAIKGYVAIGSVDDLPEEPTAEQQQKGWMLGTVLYVYVGEGGDTLGGKWQSADLKGGKGDRGESGVHLGDVALVNDLTTGGEESALTAEMGKELGTMIYGDIATIDTSSIAKLGYFIVASNTSTNNNKWNQESAGYGGKLVNVTQYKGKKARIGNVKHPSTQKWWYRFALLKDDYVDKLQYPHYCDGHFGQYNITDSDAPQWTDFTIPQDCNYIYVYDGTPSQNIAPQIDVFVTSGIIENIDAINSDIAALNESNANKLSNLIQPSDYELRNNGIRFWINFRSIKPHNVFTAYPANANYELAYLGMAANDFEDSFTESSGWTTGFYNHKPVDGTVKFVINVRKADNSAFTIDDALANIVFSCVDGDTIDVVENITHPYYERTYQGEPIDLQKNHYAVQDWGGYVNLTNSQGMAIFGGYIVQGRALESSGKTQCAIISQSTRTKVADLLLPHDGYSALHCNAMTFGDEISTGFILPHLYVSQWDGQTNCFVYDISTDGTATLKQVISASQITKDGVRFGQGYVDWYACGEYILAVSYIGSGYSGGEIVTKFKLPKISDGTTINLTDEDIIDAKYLGDYTIRQDGCYHNGKLYILHGSTGTYLPQLALRVIDTSTLREVSVVDLQWMDAEPEGLAYYDNSLLLHKLNSDRLFRMLFS